MNIVLLEFIDEYKTFSAYCGHAGIRRDDCRIIALEPELQTFLRRQGVPYETSIDYLPSSAHGTIILETERLMQYLRTRFVFTDDAGLTSCYNIELCHYSKFYINHFCKLIEIVANVHARYGAATYYACAGSDRFPGKMIRDADRFLGHILVGYAQLHGLNCQIIPSITSVAVSCSVRPGLWKRTADVLGRWQSRLMIRFLRRTPLVFLSGYGSYFKTFIRRVHAGAPNHVFLTFNTRLGLLTMTACNLAALWHALTRCARAPYLVIMPDAFGGGAASRADVYAYGLAFLAAIPDELTRYRQISFKELYDRKVTDGFMPHARFLVQRSGDIGRLLDQCGTYDMVSNGGTDIMGVAAEMTRRRGHRALFISHGTHPVPSDAIYETELRNLCRGFMLGEFTHIALSTPVQEAHLHYFKAKDANIRNDELRTGPLVFALPTPDDRRRSRERRKIADDECVIVHATTMKHRSVERFHFIETFDEFFLSVGDLIRAAARMPRTRLIIRLHPGFFLSDEQLRLLLPQGNYELNRTGPFRDALAAADVLVSYSSTAIDEALINEIPVILYDRWCRYNHFRTDPFKPGAVGHVFPVCYVNDQADLSAALSFMGDAARDWRDRAVFDAYRYTEDYAVNVARFFSSVQPSNGGLQ